jgi:hypothetical protein
MEPTVNKNIPISDLDKAEVLAALYNNSKVQGLGLLQAKPGAMTVEEARELLQHTTYFDYLHGKVMKVDLSKDTLNPGLYDRDNGPGAAQAVIQQLRNKGSQQSETHTQDPLAAPASGIASLRSQAKPSHDIEDRLRNLKEYMPNQLAVIYEFGRLLADRVSPTTIPMGFIVAAELLIVDLESGVDGFTNKPMNTNMVGYPPSFYQVVSSMVPDITKATCPPEFAQAVEQITKVLPGLNK